MLWKRYLRAWLAFLVLQAIGSIYIVCFSNTDVTQPELAPYPANTPDSLRRSHCLSVFMLAVIRLVLIGTFENAALHIVHIILTAALGVLNLLEMEYFGAITYTVSNSFSIAVNGLTFFSFLIAYPWITEQNSDKTKEPRRKGRLFAKHYMEGDLLNPPADDPHVIEMKKRC